MQNHHDLVKVDWITKDEAHPGWAKLYRAVDVVETAASDADTEPCEDDV